MNLSTFEYFKTLRMCTLAEKLMKFCSCVIRRQTCNECFATIHCQLDCRRATC